MSDNVSEESTDDPWCDSTNPRVVEYKEVESAKELICTPDGIKRTPCIRARISDLIGAEIYLKLENFNTTGSFKERGARYALMKLTDEEKQKGAVAASLGNHSQGMSYNGMKLGIPITVVMPVTAPLMKINKCKMFKANVVIEGNNMAEAKKLAKKISKDTGAVFINGYDHPYIIAGQGTVGMEILEDVENPDIVICPCGGGGLIAGIALVIKEKSPTTRVIGVEAELCAGFSKALNEGKPKRTECNQSIADGLAVPKVGYNSVATCLGKVDQMVTVSEKLLNVAILTLIENEKIVTEGAGASPLAALLTGTVPDIKDKKIVLVCSGGNIDTLMLGKVIERALASLGKLIKVNVSIMDVPSSQAELLSHIAKAGVNVKQMYSERAWNEADDFSVKIHILCELRNIEHAVEFRKKMKSKYPQCEFPDFPNVCQAKALSSLKI